MSAADSFALLDQRQRPSSGFLAAKVTRPANLLGATLGQILDAAAGRSGGAERKTAKKRVQFRAKPGEKHRRRSGRRQAVSVWSITFLLLDGHVVLGLRRRRPVPHVPLGRRGPRAGLGRVPEAHRSGADGADRSECGCRRRRRRFLGRGRVVQGLLDAGPDVVERVPAHVVDVARFPALAAHVLLVRFLFGGFRFTEVQLGQRSGKATPVTFLLMLLL